MTGVRRRMIAATTQAGRRFAAPAFALSMAVGLLVGAAAVAPAAWADPAGDADAAITAAWQTTGADTGPLGAKQGTVYSAGPGFGQDFATGTMFFTPATGAHWMQGPILDRYRSLGGPADSDLGFPTDDEGAGKAAASRNSSFSAADNPVIFWTPDTGAHVVRGAINAAWDALGGSAGTLGVPTGDETVEANVLTQPFSGGSVSYDTVAKTFSTTPPELAGQLANLTIPGDATTAIAAARRAAGGPLGPLGAAQSEPVAIAGDGLVQDFAGGKIFYSPGTGAAALTGQVLAKYESAGGPTGSLGFPTGAERDGGVAPMSRVATFSAADKPVIFWTPDYGAAIVRGAPNAAWAKLGGATGPLGAPTGDQSQNADTVTQKFSGGSVSWNSATGSYSTEPAALAGQLAGLQVPDAPAAAGAQEPPAASSSDSFGWHTLKRYWVPAAVVAGVLLFLIGVPLIARARRGSRGADDDWDDEDDDEWDPSDSEDWDADDRDFDEPDYPGRPHTADAFAGEARGVPGGRFPADAYSPQGYPGAGFPGAGYPDGSTDWSGRREPGRQEPERQDSERQDFEPATTALRLPVDTGDDATSALRVVADESGESPRTRKPDGSGSAGITRGGDERTSDDRGVTGGRGAAAGSRARGDESDTAPNAIQDPRAAARRAIGAEGRPPASTSVPGTERPTADGPDVAAAAEPVGDGNRYANAGKPEDARSAATGRHASGVPASAALAALRLATESRIHPPAGYPVKADTRSGKYWLPEHPQYPSVQAEIWFASEEFALTNGFVKG